MECQFNNECTCNGSMDDCPYLRYPNPDKAPLMAKLLTGQLVEFVSGYYAMDGHLLHENGRVVRTFMALGGGPVGLVVFKGGEYRTLWPHQCKLVMPTDLATMKLFAGI